MPCKMRQSPVDAIVVIRSTAERCFLAWHPVL